MLNLSTKIKSEFWYGYKASVRIDRTLFSV